jgi:hypothetical protein
MINGHQQQHQSSGPSHAATMNAFGVLARIFATSVEVLFHKQVGDRYLGLNAAAVLLLIPIYSVFWPGHDLRPLMGFLLVYLGAVAIARLDVVKRKRNGMRIHSLYSGYPRYMNGRTKLTELQCKQYFEPLITAIAGAGLYVQGEQPLGAYLMIAGACLFISVTMAQLQFEQRAKAMNDQVIEQEFVADRFREMRGDQF